MGVGGKIGFQVPKLCSSMVDLLITDTPEVTLLMVQPHHPTLCIIILYLKAN